MFDGREQAVRVFGERLVEARDAGEGGDRGRVFAGPQHRADERAGRVLLVLHNLLLRGRGVNQECERDRLGRLAREERDLLRDAVFKDAYVFGAEGGDEAPLRVLRRQQKVRRVRLDALDRLAVGRRRWGCCGRGRRGLCRSWSWSRRWRLCRGRSWSRGLLRGGLLSLCGRGGGLRARRAWQ